MPNSKLRMPAEWEEHTATWLTWPHDEAHWPGKFEKIPPIWGEMVKALEMGEEVHILIHDSATESGAKRTMDKAGVVGKNVHLHNFPNNYSWARDHGPIFVKNSDGKKLITHWKYNAWGGKWAHDLDIHIPTKISKETRIEELKIDMVLEGGSIDVNGKGSLLTTESCLLHKNRNPNFSKIEIENHLKKYIGVENILWLGDGIKGDDTDGHVDDITRFVSETKIVTAIEKNGKDENFKPLQENLKKLQKMKNLVGNSFEIVEIEMPSPVIYEDMRLPATYLNFYIGNRVVLLPVFNDKNDTKAIDTLSKCFPSRKIVPINAVDLVWGLGAFHCVTQQQPA